jgi:hypothetical protein
VRYPKNRKIQDTKRDTIFKKFIANIYTFKKSQKSRKQNSAAHRRKQATDIRSHFDVFTCFLGGKSGSNWNVHCNIRQNQSNWYWIK